MKKQIISIVILILVMILTIGLCGLKIYSEIAKNKDMANGNYYTKTTIKDAEFLGKFSYNSRRSNSRPQRWDEFKLVESGEIIRIPYGIDGGHTGEKNVTIAIIDYYNKDTNKHLYQEFVIHEVKKYFDNKTEY